MTQISFGGDPTGYMDPPRMSAGGGDSGGPSFIASLLDLIGLNHQVAKAPKDAGGTAPDSSTGDAKPDSSNLKSNQSQISLPILDQMGSALGTAPAITTTADATTPWGAKWLDSIKPITTIDPGASLFGK